MITINLKDIEIIPMGETQSEGGSVAAGVNKIILGEEDYGWNTYQGDIKLKTGFTSFDEGDTGFDIAVGGTDANGNNSGTIWYGFRSTDDSILMSDEGGRINLKVNPNILGGEGGSSVAGVSAINIGQNEDERYQRTGVVKLFTQWYNGSYDVSIGSGNISTSFYGLKPIDGTIQIESAGGTANGNQRCGIKISDDVMNRIATLEAQIQQLLNA